MPAANASIEAGRAFVRLFAEDSQLQRGLRNALRSVRQFANGVQAIGRTLLSGGILGSFAVGFSAKGFADFEDQLLAIKGILNPTEAQFKAISDEAERLGRETSFTALEVATAMAELARAGAGADSIIGLMGAIIDMSRGSQTGLTESAETVISTMSQFGLSLREAVNVTNILTTAANASTTTVEELGEALKYVGPIAKAVGVNAEETAAALGVLANAGLRGTVAGTQLARVMKQLGSSANRKILESKFNIDLAGDDANIEFIDILKRIGEEAKKLNKYERLGLFEDIFERGSVVAQLLGDNANAFAEMVEQIENSAGSASDLAKTMESGLGGAIRRTLSAIDGVRLAFGRALAKPLQEFSARINVVLNGFSRWIDRNHDVAASVYFVVRNMLLLGGAMIAVSTALRGFSFASEGVLKALAIIQGGVSLVIGATTAIVTALFALPLIGPVLAAGFIAGLIAGVVKLKGPLLAGFRGFQEAAGKVVSAVVDALESGRVEAALDIVAAAFNVAWAKISGSFHGFAAQASKAFGVMKATFSVVMESVVIIAANEWDKITALFEVGVAILAGVWSAISDAAAVAFGAISNAAASTWRFLSDLFMAFVDGFGTAALIVTDLAGGLFDGLRSIFLVGVQALGGVWDLVADAAASAFGFIGDAVRETWALVADFFAEIPKAFGSLHDAQKTVAQLLVYSKYAVGAISLDDFSEQMDALDDQFAAKKRNAEKDYNSASANFRQRLDDAQAEHAKRFDLATEARRLETAKAQRELENKLRSASANRAKDFNDQRTKLEAVLAGLKNEVENQKRQGVDLQAEGLKGGLQAVSFGGVNAELIFGKTNDIGKRQLDVAEKQLEELREIRKKQSKPGGVKGV